MLLTWQLNIQHRSGRLAAISRRRTALLRRVFYCRFNSMTELNVIAIFKLDTIQEITENLVFTVTVVLMTRFAKERT